VVVDMIRMFSYKRWTSSATASGHKFEVITIIITPRRHAGEVRRHQLCDGDLGRQEIPMYGFQPMRAEPAEYFDGKGESAKAC